MLKGPLSGVDKQDGELRYVSINGKIVEVNVETSVTLPEELLAEIDKADPDRSAFLERAARAYLTRARRIDPGAKETEIINANLGYLTEEFEDVLEYGAYLE